MQHVKHTKYTEININKSMHSEMRQVRQKPIQRTVGTAHLSVLMTVHNLSTQHSTTQHKNSSDNFPSNLQK